MKRTSVEFMPPLVECFNLIALSETMILLVATKATPMIISSKKFAPRPRVKIQNSYFVDYLIGFQMEYVDQRTLCDPMFDSSIKK